MTSSEYSSDTKDWINELIAKSSQAKQRAYCPYSKFRVGAALLAQDGTIITGCNVENAAFPVGVCAERTAICKAISEGYSKFKAISVITDREEYTAPCGLCRQALQEFDINVVFCAKSTPIDGKFQFRRHTLDELLPFSFGPNQLLSL